MKGLMQRWMAAAGSLAMAILLMGCDGSVCVECDGPSGAVVVEDCCGEVYPYGVDVFVIDPATGAGVYNAEVELIVATVPEQRYLAATDPDGFVRFAVEAPVDAVAVASACHPAYPCGSGDVVFPVGGTEVALFIEF